MGCWIYCKITIVLHFLDFSCFLNLLIIMLQCKVLGCVLKLRKDLLLWNRNFWVELFKLRIVEPVPEPIPVNDWYGGTCTNLVKVRKKLFLLHYYIIRLEQGQTESKSDWTGAYYTGPSQTGQVWVLMDCSASLDRFSRSNRTGFWPVWFGISWTARFGMVLKTLV